MPGSTKGAVVVDVFCGVGGLSHGFLKEGFRIAAGIDSDSSCRYAFETNNSALFIDKSIEDVSASSVRKLFRGARVRILIGCAPCRPFSMYNRRKRKNGEWRLLRKFWSLVEATKPHIVSMENVPQLQHHNVFIEFVRNLKRMGYDVSHTVVFCPDYGIPQRRRRLVLLASRYGSINLIPKTHKPLNYRTVRDAIGKLRPLEAGAVDPWDPLHRSRALGPLNLSRIRATAEGGGWQTWDDSLKLKCHKTRRGKSFRAVYGRMRWDRPGSTITTLSYNIGCGRFGHPDQNRAISLREAASLQAFPKYYRFVRRKTEITYGTQGRHIGNAVPVRLGRVIARSVKLHVGAQRGG